MIGGNIIGTVQVYSSAKNAIGESVKTWTDNQTLHGFLDFMSGDAKYGNYNSKIQESTHVFICDYVTLNSQIRTDNSRMVINGKIYNINMIDNPMELNQHIEIYLSFTGGQQ